MAQVNQHTYTILNRKNLKFNLALFWVIGLALGAWIHRSTGKGSISLIRSASTGSVSFLSLLLCTWLPFLLSALAIELHTPRLLNPIVFFKAFSLSFVSCAVSSAFGQSGWLVHCLLLFSDLLSSVVLYFFWGRFANGARYLSPSAVFGYMFNLFLIVCIDYHFIFPLLQRVVS